MDVASATAPPGDGGVAWDGSSRVDCVYTESMTRHRKGLEMEALSQIFALAIFGSTVELEAANGSIEAAGRVNNDLHAELERVRGELAETKEVEVALSSKVAEYEIELNGDPQNFYGRGRTVGLRTLILTLPKVEGEIEYVSGMGWVIKHNGDVRAIPDLGRGLVAALLKHRQGMEG